MQLFLLFLIFCVIIPLTRGPRLGYYIRKGREEAKRRGHP